MYLEIITLLLLSSKPVTQLLRRAVDKVFLWHHRLYSSLNPLLSHSAVIQMY